MFAGHNLLCVLASLYLVEGADFVLALSIASALCVLQLVL